ncbi:MAG: hypothetical protein MR691_04280 [Clostridium sp.]|nr:hypothetical protein [Clostridium sp.]
MYKDVGYFMREVQTLDNMHRPKVSYKEELFYCNELSITQNEFYQSATAGFKPEIKLETKLVDLTDVSHVKYEGRLYKILRIYKDGDNIELTLVSTVIESKENV